MSQERLPVGQLLVNLLRLFRHELATRGDDQSDAAGIRPGHLQVFGSIKADGSRLTALASSAGVSLSTMAELVDDLEGLGYLARRPDPSDGRAKLVHLTDEGWRAMRVGHRVIADIEHDWTRALGAHRYGQMVAGMQALLDALEPGVRVSYRREPGP